MASLIQHFEADFLWKVSLKILNSGIILKTFTHEDTDSVYWSVSSLHVTESKFSHDEAQIHKDVSTLLSQFQQDQVIPQRYCTTDLTEYYTI